jgi:hypothetical protein
MLTDDGISNFLMKCTKIHSMVLSYTSFGNRSIQTLCTTNPDHNDGHAQVMAFNMQELHLGGCKGKQLSLFHVHDPSATKKMTTYLRQQECDDTLVSIGLHNHVLTFHSSTTGEWMQ